ncbi:hypothetical protein GCM10011348_10320 [Marinobacterium nitratireducens]|uniref:Uncharacterized protein n=1 Tax=Marinobacterium nitratireducens TaxID=518897 RepID=A0A918DQR8_9GAMM|nr:hypothetical protein [Marinobacterium nitratireducens]GGO78428.1 hypothetical protein GCM10011348_10320 [Marinobacterium nitratireducens]
MNHQDLNTQLKQLLKSGYSIDDIRNLVIAPRAELEQAILEYQHQQRLERQQARVLRGQADFAMGLGRH